MDLPKMVWMEVDTKRNELPLRVADSAEELARICGVATVSVESSASRVRHGGKGRYVKVWIGPDV